MCDRPGAQMLCLNKKSLLTVLAFVKFLLHHIRTELEHGDPDVTISHF